MPSPAADLCFAPPGPAATPRSDYLGQWLDETKDSPDLLAVIAYFLLHYKHFLADLISKVHSYMTGLQLPVYYVE